MARVQFSHVVRFVGAEAEAHDQCVENGRRQLVHSPVEICSELPKAGQDGFGEPDVVLLKVLIAADFVALLINRTNVKLIDRSDRHDLL